ncbi:MAG TPA: glucose-6-phosphate dehydrogenase [Syntrophorhabdales bacterium]|nr:glucose-6-phosphate dehydrogenase [Syntrophorhabdales bacterium]
MLCDETTVDSQYLQTCDIPAGVVRIEPLTLVIFGGAGDLSRRKLIPSLYNLFAENELPEGFSILAFDRLEIDDGGYRLLMEQAVKKAGMGPLDASKWGEFGRLLFYLQGYFETDGDFERLKGRIDKIAKETSKDRKAVVHYMAVPPRMVPLGVEKLKFHGLAKGSYDTKIVVEKPFGEDRKSAAELNKILTSAFDDNQIYRIDHYLAKEPVDNIIFFRFSNTIFEDVWNRRYVDNVQITVAEDIGIEHRGAFYEKAGVVRDIVQNHMLQLVSLVAMEAPVGFTPDFIRDEKVRIVRSVRVPDADYVDKFAVRGQYGEGIMNGEKVNGYRQEPDVSPLSNMPTFFAAKLYVDNPRWAGVPFYLRAGKRLPRRVTEICLQFRRLPLRLFGRTCDVLEPNVLFLTIQPDERISLRFHVKYPYTSNQLYPARMDFGYGETFKTEPHLPYERLLIDVMKGDLTLFVREDTIEEMWSIVDPINERWGSGPSKVPIYRSGTWGPAEADALLEKEGRKWLTT